MLVTTIHTEDNRDELISEEMQEIVSYQPHWIIRKGNIVFFLILALLLAATWFISYPDIINGSVRLMAVNAPKLLTAKTEGKLEKLLVSNEEDVQEGQPLAYLQSTAQHEQVLALRQWIHTVETTGVQFDLDLLLRQPLPVLNSLGEMQSAYQEFQNSLEETLQLLANGYYSRKKRDLLKDLEYIAAVQQNTKQQKQLLEKDFELQEIEFSAKEKLAKDKVIAPLELNQDKSKMISKEQGLEQLDAQLINTYITEHNKRKEILELQKYITDQQQKFYSALMTLKSATDEWMQRYLVTAPVAGKILFVSFLQENQLLAINQELFYVQPPQSLYYGELRVGQHGLGKLKTGQKVLIRAESYPSEEFGYLTGQVGYISKFPGPRDSFLIKVELPHGLRTNYDKTLLFRNNLSAQAEVITDDRRLCDRFWGQLQQITRR